MGCGCGGNNARRGFVPPNPPAEAEVPSPAPSSSAGGQPQARTVTSGQGTTQSFSLVTPDGGRRSFGSRLEADAARVRAGYRGQVIPAN